ncbi:PREDICTED: uncharacterized protein LOC104815090 isoform X1 [Tarenaya hassleriana]|uniref:uncharacterized protein LOC104815090 isoform X1 n=1 Tax=Tarenaya hassleriana TaxID=28532 RepID=UPI00053C6F72|nr:PREDICTED: uncharacterized protein LOC104815090 isoform X1 [Tarenaya hassleriana]
MNGVQAMKRVPRIKFPQRHPKPSDFSSAGSEGKNQAVSAANEADTFFFSNLNASKIVSGKASLQPKRTPVSNEEIEAILLGGCF